MWSRLDTGYRSALASCGRLPGHSVTVLCVLACRRFRGVRSSSGVGVSLVTRQSLAIGGPCIDICPVNERLLVTCRNVCELTIDEWPDLARLVHEWVFLCLPFVLL